MSTLHEYSIQNSHFIGETSLLKLVLLSSYLKKPNEYIGLYNH